MGRSVRMTLGIVAALAALLSFHVIDAFAESSTLFTTSFYGSEGQVLPLSLATLAAGPKIKMGTQKPFAIAISPDGGLAFTANLAGGAVSAIDTADGTFTNITSANLKSPGSIAVSPDGSQVYVGNVYENKVAVIDVHSLTVSPTEITVGDWPEGIAFTTDGRFAYVANTEHASEGVTVIDTSTMLPVKTIKAGAPPFACKVAVSPRDGTIVVVGGCGATEGGVSVIDPTTNTATPIPGFGTDPDNALAMAPDGARAYVHDNKSGDIKVLNLITDQVEPTPLAVGQAELENMVVSHTGQFLYAPRYAAGTISQIDTATGAINPISTSLERATAAAISPGVAPHAALSVGAGYAGAATALDAGATTTPDGGPATYEWDFGDGATATTGTPTTSHVYAAPGSYTASVTVRDDEGCSTDFVYTGQTAVCSGGAQARASRSFSVTAAPPAAGGGPSPSVVVARCRVPRLKGRSLRAARRRLRHGQCRLGRVSGERGRTAKVEHQHPRAGRQLPAGTKVSVRVGG